MTDWTIYYRDSKQLQKWFNNLSKEQLKSVAKELKLLELCGNRLNMPHSKNIKQGLRELRERRFGYRIYYVIKDDTIIVIHAGDKDTQKQDIQTSLKIIKRGEDYEIK